VEAVLAWGAFDRSKNLCKLLTYICSRYFEGRADEIKEYSIAIDALERPADFDQKKDAIVRVEMHRLRMRLRQYYAGPGARDPVQIVVAEKGYVPEFVVNPAVQPLAGATPASPAKPADDRTQALLEVFSLSDRKTRRWKNLSSKAWIGLGLAMLLVAIAVVAFRSSPQATTGPRTRPVPAAGSAAHSMAAPAIADIRILAGRGPGVYTDRDEQVWEGDRYFRGGEAIACRSDIVTRGFDRNIFASMREGRFEYAIPLERGSYEAELFFAETRYGEGNPLAGGETSRQFQIQVNGSPLIQGFDILADAGMPNTADSRVLKDLHSAADGFLHLEFLPTPGRKAFVNAIWVRPGQPGRLNPIRIAARPQAFEDAAGRWWLPDRYYAGGRQVLRPTGAFGLDDPYIFEGERYGNFSYSIPVPPGQYTAMLYFCEYWWGKGHPGGTRQTPLRCLLQLQAAIDRLRHHQRGWTGPDGEEDLPWVDAQPAGKTGICLRLSSGFRRGERHRDCRRIEIGPQDRDSLSGCPLPGRP
jgi:hypothetical protein